MAEACFAESLAEAQEDALVEVRELASQIDAFAGVASASADKEPLVADLPIGLWEAEYVCVTPVDCVTSGGEVVTSGGEVVEAAGVGQIHSASTKLN